MEKKNRCLCRSSKYFKFVKFIFSYKNFNINRIFYIDYNFTLGIDFLFRNIKFINCNKFEESRIKINHKCVHLFIWESITELSNKFISKDNFSDDNNFVKKHSLNNSIPRVFKGKFIYQAYVPLKLYFYSKKFSKRYETKFLIEKKSTELSI